MISGFVNGKRKPGKKFEIVYSVKRIIYAHELASLEFRTAERKFRGAEALEGFEGGDMDEGMSAFCVKAGSVRGSGNGSTGTKCGRWNPTTEQVKVLTELFRSGLRTPSTDQIQKISSQLSFYGKIESKNVFYWFQNHKARERQKRRRVSSEERDVIHHEKISSAKHFAEMNRVSEPDRVIETLQLFPINSFDHESEKLRLRANDFKETTAFSYTIGTEIEHPPLDLRLSFL